MLHMYIEMRVEELVIGISGSSLTFVNVLKFITLFVKMRGNRYM